MQASVGIHTRFVFQLTHENSGSSQSLVKIIDPEEQQAAVSGRGVFGTYQRRVLVRAPFV
jgi:hypothetical protein